MFASKCQGECHAMMAALCDLGDPGWGDSWFSALSFVACTLKVALCDFVRGLVVVLIYGPANMTHKLSSACAETILSYHISLQQICFTHKLAPVTSPFCGCVVVCVLCWLFFCLGLFLVCFLLSVSCFGFCS